MSKLIAQNSQFGDGIGPVVETPFTENATTGTNALTNTEIFISNIIGFLTILASMFFIFYFVMGGLNWITAGGDSGKVGKARDQMIQATLGLVVIVASYALIGLIGSFLGIKILQPTIMVDQLNLINN